jgi:hypothetical protein
MFIQFGVKLIGIVYLAFGIVGFLPFGFINPMHNEGVGARYLLNLVAINYLHNIIHLAIGISALLSIKTLSRAQRWARICGPALLVLFGAGMVQAFIEGLPDDQLFLGIVPLNSPGHILHLVTGGIVLYLGLASPHEVGVEPDSS